MRPHLTHAGLAKAAAAAGRPPAPRFVMKVTVTLSNGQVETFEGVYAHTFDAYDSAFNQFADCERVVVKALGLKPVRLAGPAADAEVQ